MCRRCEKMIPADDEGQEVGGWPVCYPCYLITFSEPIEEKDGTEWWT